MADLTEIAWCDSTFNPWIGCQKVGPGCDNCYAEREFDHRHHRAKWGPGQERVRTSAHNWRKPLRWNAKTFYECDCGWRGDKLDEHSRACGYPEIGRIRTARRRVFCASLSDVFDNAVPDQWRRDLFDLIRATPNLDWQLLTKRIGNAADMMFLARGGHLPILPNVWLGATICNQEEADRDIPKLLAVPARVRFVSMEPLLGPVDLGRFIGERDANIESRGNCIPSGHGRGTDDRSIRGSMENVGPPRESVERRNDVDPVPTKTGREEQREVLAGPRDVLEQEGRCACASPCVASLQRGNTGRYDRESQERDQDRQPTGELGVGNHIGASNTCDCEARVEAGTKLSWVIVGGESGPKARPMHPDWVRSLRDQCAAAGVPFLFKQWGEWGTVYERSDETPVFREFASMQQWINKASTWVRGGICLDSDGRELKIGADFSRAESAGKFPVTIMHRVGKKAAGRLLDGVAHNEFPMVAP